MPDSSSLSSADKDTLIATLLSRLAALEAEVVALRAENAKLRAENARLREKLDRLPKTPDSSSTPPAQGHKSNGENTRRPKGKAHAGVHRPLHPNPTRKRDILASHCQHCRADVSGVAQEPVHIYDRIEIPQIKPDVTQVRLHAGICPCCAKRFIAEPAGRVGARLAVRPQPSGLCYRSALHPGDLVRTTGTADVGCARARDQRGRLGQHAQGQQVGLRASDQPDPRSPALRHRCAVG